MNQRRVNAQRSGPGLFLPVLFLASLAELGGCALNISETRSARVLRGGEIQVSEINNVVIPTSAFGDLVDQARDVSEGYGDEHEYSLEEKRRLVAAATAIALSSPGYGAHMDIGVGLGYRFDAQARVGNSVYGLSLRRGFDLGTWHASLGTRAAYNGGGCLLPYLDTLNSLVHVGDMDRFDGQLFGQIGREFGEWAKLWLGGKWMGSWFRAEIDASNPRLALGREELKGRLYYWGGFVGAAVGFRYLHFVIELSVMRVSSPEFEVFDHRFDVDGLLLAPSWGLQGSF